MFRLLAPWMFAGLCCAAQCTLPLTPNLPAGALGAGYPGTITHGGGGPWSYVVSGGALPSGLALAPSGGVATFTGTASAAGTFPFTLRVTDSAGCVGTGSFTISVGGELAVQPLALPNGTIGRSYGQTFGLSAGSVPLPVANAGIISGVLPPGLGISGSGGIWTLSGTPSTSGSFEFTIQVSSGTGYSATRRYAVTISGQSVLVVNPTALRISTRVTDPPLPPQRVDVSAADGGNYRYRVTASSPGFRLDGAAGDYATPFTLSPNIQQLTNSPGVFIGYIEVTALDGAAATVRIPVELTVQPQPNLLVDKTVLTVAMRQNDPPVTRAFQVSSSDLPLKYVVEALSPIGGNWLTLTPAFGDTPAIINVVFNPVGLPQGTYPGTIRITASREGVFAVGSPKTIAVSMTVDAANPTSGFGATPASLSFTGQVNGPLPASQPLRIDNAGGAITWTSGANAGWLGLSQPTGTTPSDVMVSVFPGGLGAGTHAGSLTFSSGGTNVSVPVTLTLSPSAPGSSDPILRVSPDSLFGSVTPSTPQKSWTINVDGLGKNLDVEFVPTVEWITVSMGSGTTPTGFNLLADASKLQPGTYQGAVIVRTTNPNGLKTSAPVNVTLYVAQPGGPSAPGVLLTGKSTMFFDWRQGAGVPLPQTLLLASAGAPVNWDASTTVTWLTLSKYTGTTPEEIEVRVSPQALGAGNYRGEIRFRRGTEEVAVVTVVLSIGGAGALRAEPSVLVYLVETGREVAPQLFSLGRFDSTVSADYLVRSAPDWLVVAPLLGKTPATVEAVIRKDRLPQAVTTVVRMEGEIAIESAAGGVRVPVLLTIVPPQGSPSGREAPWILSVTNAGSTQPGPVAPGEHVTLYGGFEGREVKVWFDANRAPLLAQEPNQLTVAVPFAVAGRASTRVRVEVDSLTSRDLEIRVVDTVPGIYTVNGSGRGFAVAFNEDGSKNSEGGAAPGSLAAVVLTGVGQTDPPGTDGAKVEGDGGPKPLTAVEIKVGGLVAEPMGCATPAGEVQGAMRCQFRVPPIGDAGDYPLLVTAGGVASQPGVLFRVR
ncbi:MAG: hypothetical protein HYX27_10355 [Acidobacteria bacterium]|nr:hypothetical protein [Acidobacteriota bacterium]